MKLDVFSLLVLLGAVQALFFSVFLLFSPSNNRVQKRSLAFFIFILSYNGFETLNWSTNAGGPFKLFELFPFIVIFGLGPSLYLYVRSFNNEAMIPKTRKHYIIIWVALAVRISLIVLWILSKDKQRAVSIVNWTSSIAELLSVIWFWGYYVLAVRAFRKLVPENTKNGSWVPEEAALITRWLKTLLIVMGIFAVTWFVTVIVPTYVYHIWSGPQYYVLEVMLVVFIYWIGFTGYQRTKVIYITQQKKTQSYFDNLPKEEVEGSVSALQQAMEQDRLYLDPDINVNSLAAHLKINPKTLSAVLNQHLNKGFAEYVNAWRVEAVKKMMLDPANGHLTITGMAYECGFNSQPTFQRAFKTQTGQTPREFQAMYMQNLS